MKNKIQLFTILAEEYRTAQNNILIKMEEVKKAQNCKIYKH